ncbi:glutathione S-transferase family protein [Cyanobium sp. PCC 7001]|uniref:glutathione S-transferase family protein n=1 Tax=Cyanobium sp. PCC 7001 TaxID=180281 RepID=UPI0005B7BD4E|nr:glutathione S-transferase family protein [Cyanobium sp. PCC 7001]
MEPLAWDALASRAAAPADRVNGPTNAQARLRLFGHSEADIRVTLYRDHHAWCPYCQKVWLWLEERRIPYRIRKVTMVCYGDKEAWYRQRVPSGMLPALELDGRLITESDRILEALERAFGPLQASLLAAEVMPLRQLERLLFRTWCSWLCQPHRDLASDRQSQLQFQRTAAAMEAELERSGGPWLLESFSSADLVFVPYVERMNASLAYYKGFLLRQEHPALHRWFTALEQRRTYRGTQGDFHTHAHDLPPQMGGCFANGSDSQRALAQRIDTGPWPLTMASGADPETSEPEPEDAASVALARMLRHRKVLQQRPALAGEAMDQALRCALTTLIGAGSCPPPPGTAAGLRNLRDRISVPRDMPLQAARRLRQALEATALLDPTAPRVQAPALPLRHRRDQDPRPFLESCLG